MKRYLNAESSWQAIATLVLAVVWHGSAAAESTDTALEASEPRVEADSPIAAGRYIVHIAACNDCHTPNWMETNGDVPEEEWLTGVPIGWRGPWGTTYASNLRRFVQETTEDGFVAVLRARVERPPMPWMNVNKLSDADARAIYRYIRSLGMRGEKMPAAVGPEQEPATPYYLLEPIGTDRVADVATEDAE